MNEAGYAVLEPVDAFAGGVYRREHDLSLPEVRARHMSLAQSGRLVGIHCGVTSRTFSQLFRRFSHGTRTRECPEGTDALPGELQANEEAGWMRERVAATI